MVVPAHDEQARITETLHAIIDYLSKRNASCELIVVADRSTDDTFQVVREVISDAPFPCDRPLEDRRRDVGQLYRLLPPGAPKRGELDLERLPARRNPGRPTRPKLGKPLAWRPIPGDSRPG